MKINTDLMFSSETDEWETPQYLFDQLNKEFDFQMDVCATFNNKKVDRYCDKEINGLAVTWDKQRCWMNPPYGRKIVDWVSKAYQESLNGSTVVCLVPARTDTRWWHDYCMKGEIRFIKGRLKFGGHKYNAPFPSALVIFKPICNVD